MRSAVVIWGSLCLVVGAQNIWGPSEVTTRYGDTLSVTCGYTDGFQSYVKYWCKGEAWKSCAVIIKSGDRSQHKYSIQDYPGEQKFTITGRGMRAEDSDTYYCGMERTFTDDMHAVRVTVLPGVCRKTGLWPSIVDFPPGFVSIAENRAVEVSCKEQYEKRTFSLTCVKELDVFQLYPYPETAPCTRKCERMRNWGQNILMYPEKEYYGQDEEVTLTCPADHRPNYSKIQCIRINGNNIWNVTEVFCIYSPRKCERMMNWGQNIHMYPEKEYYSQDEEVTLTCPADHRPNYSKIQCMRINGTDIWNVTEVFCIYSPRKCERMRNWGQNISMYPEKEHYGQDEEVTLTCPAEYHPNYSKIQCIRINGTDIWNVTEVFCIYSPKITPTIPIHSPSWKNIGVSFCFGVISPMVVKLITILVILVIRVYLKRSTSSVEERPSEREPDTRVMHSPHRARTNVYHKVTEDQKITADTENDPELIYANVEADPSCNVYTTTC